MSILAASRAHATARSDYRSDEASADCLAHDAATVYISYDDARIRDAEADDSAAPPASMRIVEARAGDYRIAL